MTANYHIIHEDSECVVIKDDGPWDRYMTVTNAADSVVAEMAPKLGGRRLFYIDSFDVLDELLVTEDGRLGGYAPGSIKMRARHRAGEFLE